MENISLKLPSNTTAYSRSQSLVEQISDYLNINNSLFGNLLVCVNEALENAIVHGNQNMPSKWVYLSASYSSHKVVITITDEGKGFPAEEVMKNNAEAGEGLFLIATLCDSTEFRDEGRTLEMTFNVMAETAITTKKHRQQSATTPLSKVKEDTKSWEG